MKQTLSENQMILLWAYFRHLNRIEMSTLIQILLTRDLGSNNLCKSLTLEETLTHRCMRQQQQKATFDVNDED